MPVDALAPKVASASAGMVLAVQDSQLLLSIQRKFHLLGSSQIQDTIQIVNVPFIIFNSLRWSEAYMCRFR